MLLRSSENRQGVQEKERLTKLQTVSPVERLRVFDIYHLPLRLRYNREPFDRRHGLRHSRIGSGPSATNHEIYHEKVNTLSLSLSLKASRN